MKTTKILKIEKIEGSEFAMGATIITLDSIPTPEEMDKLFGNDESIILEF